MLRESRGNIRIILSFSLNNRKIPSKIKCCICDYLDQYGCLSHVQKLFSLQTSSEPTLKEDDLAHYVFVQRVLQLLSLQLLQEHLDREKNTQNVDDDIQKCRETNVDMG